MTHYKKLLYIYFDDVESGRKPFEVRNEDDCTYNVGDDIVFCEVDLDGNFTGRRTDKQITYILRNRFYCKDCFAILGLADKKEKAMPCEFCKTKEFPDKTFSPKEGYTFYAGYYKQMAVDEFEEYETDELNYCPVCGRKLNGGNRT